MMTASRTWERGRAARDPRAARSRAIKESRLARLGTVLQLLARLDRVGDLVLRAGGVWAVGGALPAGTFWRPLPGIHGGSPALGGVEPKERLAGTETRSVD